MKRIVVDRFGGPEVLRVVEDEDPRPGPGEVRVKVLTAGVSFTDALLRAGTYLGVPTPPFTPGYELVGVVEQLGPGGTRLHEGDRVAALTAYGAYAERVCVPEAEAVEVPADLDPAEVVGLVLTYMTAYQLLHRMAKVKRGESVLVHGAAGRVGTRGARTRRAGRGWRLRDRVRARSRRGRAARRGGDRLPQRRLPRPGARADRRRCGCRTRRARWRDVAALVSRAATGRTAGDLRALLHAVPRAQELARGGSSGMPRPAGVALWGLLPPRRRVLAYRIQKLRDSRQLLPVAGHHPARLVGGGPRDPEWFREDFHALLALLRGGGIHPVVAERLPLTDARRAHELLEQSAAKGKLVLVP